MRIIEVPLKDRLKYQLTRRYNIDENNVITQDDRGTYVLRSILANYFPKWKNTLTFTKYEDKIEEWKLGDTPDCR